MSDFSYQDFRLRLAVPDDAAALTELTHASKAHWGYPAEWIVEWRETLTVTREYIEGHRVWIAASRENAPLGFYALLERADGRLELDFMFVAPKAIGRGIGRHLFEHAVASARELGYDAFEIDADPFAAGFYGRMGSELRGVYAAPMSGAGPDGPGADRTRPQFRFTLGRTKT